MDRRDFARVEAAVAHVYEAEGLPTALPLYAFGASSGGALVGGLARSVVLGPSRLRCRIPQIMRVPGHADFSRRGAMGDLEGAADALRAHATRRAHGGPHLGGGLATPACRRRARRGAEVRAAARLRRLLRGAHRRRHPRAVRGDGRGPARRGAAGRGPGDGLLAADPRKGAEWREALLATGVPQELGDSLEADASAICEEMNVAWASHEMCSTFAEDRGMLDFCEDPAGACARHGMDCGGGRAADAAATR
ncbi:unnamed protein product [Prorocentrum cordatum]|uniref:Uncharacterized protein n=1 Tax=Prorocentrum cordatum TaxID=2364126 RepID=A0ABN9WTS5_9DINO|nr:unnamed protein product [Polarella glacialis]